MKTVNASYEIILPYESRDEAKRAFYTAIERAGRTCYKSESKITDESAGRFVRQVVSAGHEAMLEHASLTVRFIVDRGVSHELVRHRLSSFAQESTRYCNYSHDRFGRELTFVKPCFWSESSPLYAVWKLACEMAEEHYLRLLVNGATPEQARGVLPNSLKTEVVMTANMREWRHFFKLRALGTTGKPHPQMQEVALPLLHELGDWMPELFGDLTGGNAK